MKAFLQSLQSRGLLSTVNKELSPILEISSILYEMQDRPTLFEKVTGSQFRLAGNLYGNREYLEMGLNLQGTGKSLADAVQLASNNPSTSKGKVSKFSNSIWEHNETADLTKLPILKHFEFDVGRYMTAGIVVARFPGSDSENLSFHRMLVLSKDKVAARIVPRHLNQIARDQQGQKIPVSIVIGPPPAVFLAASLQTGYDLSEYRIANRMMEEKLELVSSELVDLAIPLDSEIVLEGKLDYEDLVDEGPFVDLTGTYDEVRKQPVITLKRMHYRRDSVYQAVVASSREHALFMGLPQELKIRDALSKSIPKVYGINLTPASGGYFHCIVSIDKGNDGDGKTAILNCLAASHPLKLVIVVDSDVNPFDWAQVEWALATRFQADKGLVVVSGARGSSLDPSSGKLAVTSKLGLDATLPTKENRKKFSKARIEISPQARSILSSLGIRPNVSMQSSAFHNRSSDVI